MTFGFFRGLSAVSVSQHPVPFIQRLCLLFIATFTYIFNDFPSKFVTMDAIFDSESEESDFEGFTEEDIAQSAKQREQSETNELNFDESDIDINSDDFM